MSELKDLSEIFDLDMCFLVEATEVIMCCTKLDGPGTPSFLCICMKITPLQPESRLAKCLYRTKLKGLRHNYNNNYMVIQHDS